MDNASKLADVKARIKDVERLRYVASETRDAAAFGRLDRELEALWREEDRLSR